MRQLATIQRVTEVSPIENADAIETSKIRGWQSVTKKGEFKPGDLAVYHEIDSLLPLIPQYEFLAKGSSPKTMIVDGFEVKGFRLKTIKLRGVLSQGLALPLSDFPQIKNPIEGMDVTSLLCIKLYEAPLAPCLAGEVRGSFPGYIPKTDEERIQNLLPWLEDYRGKRFYVTVKIDGSSCTIYKCGGDFGVCSRNLNMKPTEKNTFWKIANQYDLINKLPEGYAIQGEVAGEGIQDNRHKLKGQDLYVFYVYDIDKGIYLELDQMQAFCKDIGLKTVPVYSDDFILNHTLEQLLVLADGPCPLSSQSLLREGLVFRLKGSGQKISFKVISNAYLLKYGL